MISTLMALSIASLLDLTLRAPKFPILTLVSRILIIRSPIPILADHCITKLMLVINIIFLINRSQPRVVFPQTLSTNIQTFFMD